MKTMYIDPIRNHYHDLIEDTCAVGQFEDDCIYLIAESDSEIARRAKDISLLYQSGEKIFDKYRLEVVQHVELKNHPKIREAIELHGVNLIMQLPSFSQDAKKRFIVVRSIGCLLVKDVATMMYRAHLIAHSDVVTLFCSFAQDEVDEFVRFVRYAIRHAFFEKSAPQTEPPSPPRAPGKFYIVDLEWEDTLTYRQKLDLYDQFGDNLKRYHKSHDPRIKAKIEAVVEDISQETWSKLLQNLSPKLQQRIADFVNPRRLAEASTMDLEIRWSADIDKTHKNDGHYRLYLNKGDKRQMVHFSRSAGFILYLIYLLDRKKNGDKVDTLNILHYKQLFAKLYEKTYGVNGEATFADMVKNYNAVGKVQQKALYNVMKSMREDVGMVCERMLEPAEPFVPRDITAHLTVLPEHIVIPNELLELC